MTIQATSGHTELSSENEIEQIYNMNGLDAYTLNADESDKNVEKN